jgi:alkanesulfonate monooxygenase SsuD/methylene tetrahydromethanopterin reductase-like flavin-dependent oxidoreductase (luciferase family)
MARLKIGFIPIEGGHYYKEALEEVTRAEELGLDSAWMEEHHSVANHYWPSPMTVLAGFATRTSRMMLGTDIVVAAFHHPVRLAEDVAMLDVMSGGRIISGFVRGVPQEYLALDGSLAESRARLEEAWDLIVKAWTEREPFAWHGKHWSYERVSIWPRPLQQPHPPIVLPADSDEGLELAARRRVPTGAAYRSLARTKAIFDRYRASAARHGWTPAPEDCHVLRHVYVADTNARAREEAEPHLDYFWGKLLTYHRGSMKLLGQAPPAPPREVRVAEDVPLYAFDFELTQRDGITFVGDPDHVIREIRAQMRELGAGTLMALLQFGSLPHALACKNARLFAERVLPELRRG